MTAKEVKPDSTQTPPTALSLLAKVEVGEVDSDVVLNAMLEGNPIPISVSEVRRYLVASGKKVDKNADLLISIAANVEFLKVLHRIVANTNSRIRLLDAVAMIEQQFGIKVEPRFVKMLQLG